VFVISFLMICLLTLVKLLMSWIISINAKDADCSNSQESNEKKIDFYTKSIGCFLIATIASAICIGYNHKNQDINPKQDDSKSNNQNGVFFINTEKSEKLAKN